MPTDLSFVIPALNEERSIGTAVDSINNSIDDSFLREIIVCDNGSSDETVVIARSKGARVVEGPGLTIAALRNAGASEAGGKTLVFLDADVHLASNWGTAIGRVLADLQDHPETVTGSTVGPGGEGGWIERHWFRKRRGAGGKRYINSGHMIVLRSYFFKVGGFDENLESGEDSDFCERARRMGGRIVDNPELAAIHEGFPRTTGDFFRRERWHGRGDYVPLRRALRSRPAILSLTLLLLLIFLLTASLSRSSPCPFAFWTLLLFGTALLSAFRRNGELGWSLIPVAALFCVYFAARAMAFLDVALESGRSGRPRWKS